jgi:hypothetical protein
LIKYWKDYYKMDITSPKYVIKAIHHASSTIFNYPDSVITDIKKNKHSRNYIKEIDEKEKREMDEQQLF